ncbi:substrate-binding periplasmic protein [Paraglaciecola arctica]|uniref:substrate-binding periplasmic protein n=1 Tax=Paraglaciecola arctica TaxID=1128911 RepID=UPI001C06CC7C|nr:hypothetical protein [Paraglaciecola arctica]MBU3005754.1 hypothetical protein [Paraglaciecola arctica]
MWKSILSVYVTFIYLVVYSPQTDSREIVVGLEPFPPLINEDGSGLVVDMLRKFSATENIRFTFEIMTYARAKKNLRNKKLELIGMTPYQLETDEFYQYATELDWHIDTHVHLFALDKSYFNISQLPTRSIGTLLGNAEFLAEIVGLPEKKFVEVSQLEQLVKMLALGRLKVILFEGVATMNTIKSLGLQGVYYKEMGIVPSTLAIPKSAEGLILKQKLDAFLINPKNQNIFNEFIHYIPSNHVSTLLVE